MVKYKFMIITLLILIMLTLGINSYAVELDSDANDAIDIAKGGTNAATAAAARVSLGLEIGEDVQAYDADTAKNDVSAAVSGDRTFSGTVGFEGSTADDYETNFVITDPTADRTITVGDFNTELPAATTIDATGKVVAAGLADDVASAVVTAGLGTSYDTDAKFTALFAAKEDVLTNEAGLYSALSDVTVFYEPGDTLQTNSGTTLPLTCTTGEMFLDTDADTDGSLYACVDTDTWKEVDDDGGEGGAGYTDLTEFVDQTAWRVFYSDTNGDVTELALGSAGTFLGSNGATSAPTWSTPAGTVEDDVYSSGWDSDTTNGASQNAIYDYLHQIDTDDDGSLADENFTFTGDIDFTTANSLLFGSIDAGGAVLEIPNGASGTTDATGEIYLDTDGDGGTNFSGPLVQLSTNGATLGYIFPIAALPQAATQDDYILKYDAVGKTIQFEADAGAAGGDSISIDSSSVVDPDFVSTGDIDFVDTSNTITANLNEDVVGVAEMADADHGDVSWTSGVATVEAVSGANAVDSDAYVDGSIDSVHIASYSQTTVLAEPDQVQPISDAWLIKYFPAETFPSGVTIDAIHIVTSETCTDVLNFEEWAQDGVAATSTVEEITLSGTFTEDDGTLADAAIAADGRLMVDLPATPTDIAFYEVTVIYHAN